jgi:hypothetical protein
MPAKRIKNEKITVGIDLKAELVIKSSESLNLNS